MMPLRSILLVALALTLLSACGRRGALEEPGTVERTPTAALLPLPPARATPETEAGAGVESTPVGDTVMLDPSSPGAQEPEVTRRDVPLPQRRFFLDPLL